MKKMVAFVLMTILATNLLMAQDHVKPSLNDVPVLTKQKPKAERRWGDAGFGLGLDYGGLVGVKATFYPIPYMGVFGAVGWEMIGIGWNVGCLGRLIPANGTHTARPYLKAMYGVNGATKVTGKSGYDEMFYGFTAGIGVETRFGKHKQSGINIDLNFPFRSPEFFDQIARMKSDPELDMTQSPIPIAISIGYNFEF